MSTHRIVYYDVHVHMCALCHIFMHQNNITLRHHKRRSNEQNYSCIVSDTETAMQCKVIAYKCESNSNQLRG